MTCLGKRVARMWGTRVGETITNIIWGITARVITTAQNMMFYTMLWVFPNWLYENAPSWLSVTGIRDVHKKMHPFIGQSLYCSLSVLLINMVLSPILQPVPGLEQAGAMHPSLAYMTLCVPKYMVAMILIGGDLLPCQSNQLTLSPVRYEPTTLRL